MNDTVRLVEDRRFNVKESKCYASCSDCYHKDRENFFRCEKLKEE